ncbi:Hsp20 family protein [Reyranella sp. CPCC 100927]|uniref:Hsp20 family protein n=1 Tax=Reyranella sp. CPCC 100927 TaxID=2599616 RepID=UPI0011B619DF|nr:Hsp20 family protein [Reyranella sp. CPCC 100927]TWT13611.1 Hsp20 family protein [Reyranella sp. CPCC 100927]
MRAFDFSPLFRSTVGFDRVFQLLDTVSNESAGNGYPPYNIEKSGDSGYRITLAVAGFTDKDIEVVQQENALRVSGKIVDRDTNGNGNGSYLHRGIATRAFDRRFELADHVRVTGAALENGLLHIDLVREVPEEKKPRVVPIAGPAASRPALQAAE